MRTVELHQAFMWDCEDCGRGNLVRAVTLAPETIDPDDLPELGGMDRADVAEWLNAGGQGAFVMAPQRVRCEHCGAEFGTGEGNEGR